MSDTVEFVEFFGEQFRVPQRINARIRQRIAALSAQGMELDENDPKAQKLAQQAALLIDKMVTGSVRPEDRERFEEVCDRECPSDEELMQFAMDVLAAASGRPTMQPSVSSDGPTIIQQSSEADSSLAVIHRLEQAGRPDQAYIVQMAQEARAQA